MRGVLLPFIAALSLALAARAEDTWKQHYERGATLFDLEKYLDAAKEFEAAYELKQNAAFLFNIGQSYRLAGKPDKAIPFYKSYLRRLPNAGNRAEVEARIAELEKLVEQQRKAAAEPPHGTIETAPAPPAPVAAAPAPARAPELVRAAPAPLVAPATARHFALRAGFGAAAGVLGTGLEFRPTFVGIVLGTGVYAGTAGLTFGPADNNGGFYVDAVLVVDKPGVFNVKINTGCQGTSTCWSFGGAVSAGWDLRPWPFLSVKLGAGVAHNWGLAHLNDGKPHLLTFDVALGPVF